MKITKSLKNGAVRWRVNDPQGPHGKRQRRWFPSEAEARRYVKQRTDDRNSFGIWFSTMPARDRAALGYHLQRLTAAGWSLEAAVDFVLKHGKSPPTVSLERVVDEFLTAKQVAGLRSYYVRKLSASIRRFMTGREKQPIAEITPLDIQDYIASNGWQPATMRSYLVDVKTLFAFAVKRKFLRDNPAAAVDLPRLDDKPPGLLSPAHARTVLNACLDHEPEAVAVLALCLFGGLRRAEAEQLEWAEIGDEFIEVKAHKAKTRRRRLVPITAQLRAWMEFAREAETPLPASNFNNRFTRLVKHAGLHATLPQNAMRHSFASYHFAKHRNENETAAIMGNSPQMVFAHYREMVRPSEADAFFALLPPADGVKRALAARGSRAKPTPPPAPPEKITATALAAIFDQGSRWLRRAEAARLLVVACGCSIHSAKKAFTKRGRHWDSLMMNPEGLVTWRSATMPGASLVAAATVPEVPSPTGG